MEPNFNYRMEVARRAAHAFMPRAKRRALEKRARATTVTKLLNVRELHAQVNHSNTAPEPREWLAIHRAAAKAGVLIDRKGRCYVPFQRATPYLPNGRHGRWENGKVVERKRP